MSIIYYDCFAGISGDMNLAAMLELGVPLEYLKDELAKLNVSGYEISVKPAIKNGISGTQVDVILSDTNNKEHDHHSEHNHNHHKHTNHSHRTFKKIRGIINASELSNEVKATSIEIFNKIAIAEGKIHNKAIDEVHFHEVGATDSIVDIVGSSICYHYLNPTKVLCSTIELGGGFVNCAHGKFPVPAPATLEIVKNIPIKKGVVNFETTTPTGAAILATIVDEFTDSPEFKITKTSYGIGHRDLEIPNVLRVHSATQLKAKSNEASKIIEFNIDDMSGEQIGYLTEILLEAGAVDVFLTPIIMKKSRPGNKLSVLCQESNEVELAKIIFMESSTLGYRSYVVNKQMLDREIIRIETKFGDIDIKVAYFDDEELKIKPEFEQCKIAALKNNVPLRVVTDEVIRAYNNKTNE